MIAQKTIDALGLTLSPMQNGIGYINNVGIYEWPELTYDERQVYVSDGDRGGRPLPDGRLMVYVRKGKYWGSFLITEEILHTRQVKAICEKLIDGCLRKAAKAMQ